MSNELKRLEFLARINIAADYARRQARISGVGSNYTIQAAVHVLRLIDDYRSQFGG